MCPLARAQLGLNHKTLYFSIFCVQYHVNECDEQAKPHGISGKWFATHGYFAQKWQKWQKMVKIAIKNSHFYFSLLYYIKK